MKVDWLILFAALDALWDCSKGLVEPFRLLYKYLTLFLVGCL